MRIVFFDLGNTLEHNDKLLPGAKKTLTAVQAMTDADGTPVVLGLISDFHMTEDPEEIRSRQQEYYRIVEHLEISSFFEPAEEKITLSTEVGAYKPDEKIFRAAIGKIIQGLDFHHVIFITENKDHVAAARQLGMMAIHFQGPGQTSGEVAQLVDLIPLIERLIRFSPCRKKAHEAVGRFVSPAAKNKKIDETIQALTSQVDTNNLRSTISNLVEFGTRWSYSPNMAEVQEFIHREFVRVGYPADTQTRYQDFTMPGASPQRNVLSGKGNRERGSILVCCHYDSISEEPGIVAPGADDNASGVAAILELARLLRDVDLKRDLVFAAFGGEEQGLFGSGACAEIAAKENWPIDLVINLDMISYRNPTGDARIVVEYDQGNRNPGNDAAAKAYGLIMAQAAADYTSLEVDHTDIWNSDYMPFEAEGYACIGVFESGDSPFYHHSTDTIDSVDIAYLGEVVKMVLATILVVGR